MAVPCKCINVIVPVATLQEKYPGGVAGDERVINSPSFCNDELVTRVGFMAPIDVKFWIDSLEEHGLVLLEHGTFADIAVVDMLDGLTAPCTWLGTDVIDGVRWAWLEGGRPRPLTTPAGRPSPTGGHFTKWLGVTGAETFWNEAEPRFDPDADGQPSSDGDGAQNDGR